MLARALHLQSTPYANTNCTSTHTSSSSKVRAWLAVGCGDDAADMAVVLRHHHRLNNCVVEGCALAPSLAFDNRNPNQRCHACSWGWAGQGVLEIIQIHPCENLNLKSASILWLANPYEAWTSPCTYTELHATLMVQILVVCPRWAMGGGVDLCPANKCL
jgi:hypothetical protein